MHSGQLLKRVIRSNGDVECFDPSRIAESLIRELNVSRDLAEEIADQVARQGNGKTVFASDIRQAVVTCLRDRAMIDESIQYSKIGLTAYDIGAILNTPDRENANIDENPESISGRIAGQIVKEYTLRHVFDKCERFAHTSGRIHVHDLDYFPLRAFCFGNDLRDVFRKGLPPIDGWSHSVVSSPSRNPMVSSLHAAKWLGCLTREFAGGLGYDMVNVMLAPYVYPMNWQTAKQIAQCLVFEISQLFISRKGQSPFSSITIYPTIPEEWRNVEAVTFGGKIDGVYGDYTESARMLFLAFIEVFKEKDGAGKPFNFPKLEVGWKKEWEDKRLMDCVHSLAADCGAPYYVNLDVLPPGTKTQCCRMALRGDKIVKFCRDTSKLGVENSQRMGSLQTISLNLPMLCLTGKYPHDDIMNYFFTAEKILLKKREIIRRFIEEKRILGFCSGLCDGRPYLDIDLTHLTMGFVGLNEAVKIVTGYELHEDETAVEEGERIIRLMSDLCVEASDRNQCLFNLWEAPAESCASRMAGLTKKVYPDVPVCGTDSPYFTNSDHVRYDADVPLLDRINIARRLQEPIDGGTIFHAFVGSKNVDFESFRKLISRIIGRGIKYTAVTFDYTTCPRCGSFRKGVNCPCSSCGCEDVDVWSRVTGYFSRVARYNAAKHDEWRNRQRVIP